MSDYPPLTGYLSVSFSAPLNPNPRPLHGVYVPPFTLSASLTTSPLLSADDFWSISWSLALLNSDGSRYPYFSGLAQNGMSTSTTIDSDLSGYHLVFSCLWQAKGNWDTGPGNIVSRGLSEAVIYIPLTPPYATPRGAIDRNAVAEDALGRLVVYTGQRLSVPTGVTRDTPRGLDVAWASNNVTNGSLAASPAILIDKHTQNCVFLFFSPPQYNSPGFLVTHFGNIALANLPAGSPNVGLFLGNALKTQEGEPLLTESVQWFAACQHPTEWYYALLIYNVGTTLRRAFSTDGGLTWTDLGSFAATNINVDGSRVTAFDGNPYYDGSLLSNGSPALCWVGSVAICAVATEGGLMAYVSRDRGRSWQPPVLIDPDATYTALSMVSVCGRIYLLGFFGPASSYNAPMAHTLFCSGDLGATWQKITTDFSSAGGPNYPVQGAALGVSSRSGNLYIVRDGFVVLASSDGGKTWSWHTLY